jgi:hypothetical protein
MRAPNLSRNGGAIAMDFECFVANTISHPKYIETEKLLQSLDVIEFDYQRGCGRAEILETIYNISIKVG